MKAIIYIIITIILIVVAYPIEAGTLKHSKIEKKTLYCKGYLT
jgi:hypothetical protein